MSRSPSAGSNLAVATSSGLASAVTAVLTRKVISPWLPAASSAPGQARSMSRPRVITMLDGSGVTTGMSVLPSGAIKSGICPALFKAC